MRRIYKITIVHKPEIDISAPSGQCPFYKDKKPDTCNGRGYQDECSYAAEGKCGLARSSDKGNVK